MTKEEIKQLENQIKDFIKTLDQYNNEELVYYYKCALSRDTTQRGLYTPLIKAIEQIRLKKGWVQESSNKGTALEKTEITLGSKIQYKNKKGAKK
jgi:hypothetical protein